MFGVVLGAEGFRQNIHTDMLANEACVCYNQRNLKEKRYSDADHWLSSVCFRRLSQNG